MNEARTQRIAFGDFQTPDALAAAVCRRLRELGVSPASVVEPTCGAGAFVLAALDAFPGAQALCGVEINRGHLHLLEERLRGHPGHGKVRLQQADFFRTDWKALLAAAPGPLLVVGNLPWVTSSAQGAIGGANLPAKSNFQGRSGFEAISGQANFDISEWMLLELLRALRGRSADLAMLVKSAVARKVLAQSAGMGVGLAQAMLFGIDARQAFGATVDACLLVMRLPGQDSPRACDYTVFEDLQAQQGRRVAHRDGLTVADLDAFEAGRHLLGASPQKWRSGIKHDASAVMELARTGADRYENGLGERCSLEPDYLYPLLKGSDVASGKPWREKFVLVTQCTVGQPTDAIRDRAPRTWAYLAAHAAQLDARASRLHANKPRFSVFGVGEYTFRPWRIAVCSLYKRLQFRLVGPVEGRPVQFDDTVYFVSFETEAQARGVLRVLQSQEAQAFLSSLIFWDEKRQIKAGLLNRFDWSRAQARGTASAAPECAAGTSPA